MVHPAHILVVDDEVAVRDTLAALLRHRGYTVAVAGDGATALLQITKQAFDLVVLDLLLPGMHGRELVYHIRARQTGAAVFVLTGTTEPEHIPEEVDAYLRKTVTPQEVLMCIANLLRREHAGPVPAWHLSPIASEACHVDAEDQCADGTRFVTTIAS